MAENVGSDPIEYSPLNPVAGELGLVLSETGDTGDFLLFDNCTGEEDGLDFFPFVLRFLVGETRLNCLVALKGRGPVEGEASLLTPKPVLLDMLLLVFSSPDWKPGVNFHLQLQILENKINLFTSTAGRLLQDRNSTTWGARDHVWGLWLAGEPHE